MVDVDHGSSAAGAGADSALPVDDRLALSRGGEAVGAADVEDGVSAGGQDGGEVGVAEHLLELGGADGPEPGELAGRGARVVGDLGHVDGQVDVGAHALVLRQAGGEHGGEQGVESRDAADADGAVVLGAGGCGQ